MKQCPTCQSQYTDDSLQFCLQDGSPLGFVGDSQEGKTIAFGEQETVVAGNRPSGQINQPHLTNPTDWNPNQYQSSAGVSAEPPGKSNMTMAVIVTVFVMLLIFSGIGIGAWLFLRGATPDDKGNLFITKSTPYPETQPTRATTANANTSIKTAPAATPLTSSSNNNANTTVDADRIRSEVTARLDSWKSASEAFNLDAHMSHYAPTVDYYNRKGASASVVRADKQRAYTTFETIQLTLSNITVTPDASGETATAVFDKEWNFGGARTSSGKVQQAIKLRKIDGQWLITGERDLKVYYTR
jgi:hypothetical protein